MRTGALLGVGLLLTAVAGAAQISALFTQDITLHETTTSAGGPMGAGKTTAGASYFSGNAMKHTSADGNDVIIRYDQHKIITVNHPKKTYTEMSLDDLQRMLDKATESAKMKKEDMEALQQMMGKAAGEVSVTGQGSGGRIAEYATEKYLIRMSPMEIQIWAAPDLTMPAVYYDALKISVPSNPLFDMSKMYDEFKKIKGMTMKTVMNMKMMGMEMTTTTVVTSVDKGSIPGSTFEVPAGYKAAPPKF